MRESETQLLSSIYESILLKEMPVRDVKTLSQTIGGTTQPIVKPSKDSSERDKRDYADQMLIRNASWKNKVKLQVAPKVPFVFDIIFEDNLEATADIRGDIPAISEFLKTHIKPTAGVITAVLNSSGDPMTPWIISHKIGHAIFDYYNYTNDNAKAHKMGELRRDCNNLLNLMIKRILDLSSTSATQTIPDYAVNVAANLIHQSPAATFKSARDKTLNGLSEYLYELVAMYLQKGQIKFDPILVNGEPKVDSEGVIMLDQNKATVFTERLQKNIIQALEMCVGEVIADY
jgi:hypothetical protein